MMFSEPKLIKQEIDSDIDVFDTDSLKSASTTTHKTSDNLKPPDALSKKSKSFDRINVMVTLSFSLCKF